MWAPFLGWAAHFAPDKPSKTCRALGLQSASFITFPAQPWSKAGAHPILWQPRLVRRRAFPQSLGLSQGPRATRHRKTEYKKKRLLQCCTHFCSIHSICGWHQANGSFFFPPTPQIRRRVSETIGLCYASRGQAAAGGGVLPPCSFNFKIPSDHDSLRLIQISLKTWLHTSCSNGRNN